MGEEGVLGQPGEQPPQRGFRGWVPHCRGPRSAPDGMGNRGFEPLPNCDSQRLRIQPPTVKIENRMNRTLLYRPRSVPPGGKVGTSGSGTAGTLFAGRVGTAGVGGIGSSGQTAGGTGTVGELGATRIPLVGSRGAITGSSRGATRPGMAPPVGAGIARDCGTAGGIGTTFGRGSSSFTGGTAGGGVVCAGLGDGASGTAIFGRGSGNDIFASAPGTAEARHWAGCPSAR